MENFITSFVAILFLIAAVPVGTYFVIKLAIKKAKDEGLIK